MLSAVSNETAPAMDIDRMTADPAAPGGDPRDDEDPRADDRPDADRGGFVQAHRGLEGGVTGHGGVGAVVR
jgi:hypothetical protein